METIMKEFGKMIVERDKESLYGQMETNIKENGRKIKKMDLVHI
tara:strand:- start:296 stop:427 length:132 start_codon:yes stop_codon:yes gene_type:complete